MWQKAISAVNGGGSLTLLGTVDFSSSTNTTITWSLASIPNAENLELFVNCIPVLKNAVYRCTTQAYGVTLSQVWSYDKSTKTLTLTEGNTSYIYFAPSQTGSAIVDIYAVV